MGKKNRESCFRGINKNKQNIRKNQEEVGFEYIEVILLLIILNLA